MVVVTLPAPPSPRARATCSFIIDMVFVFRSAYKSHTTAGTLWVTDSLKIARHYVFGGYWWVDEECSHIASEQRRANGRGEVGGKGLLYPHPLHPPPAPTSGPAAPLYSRWL